MASSLFGSKPSVPQTPTALNNNPMEMIQQFNKFLTAMKGRNPEQMLNALLSTNQMTQGQYAQIMQIAPQIVQMLKGLGIK